MNKLYRPLFILLVVASFPLFLTTCSKSEQEGTAIENTESPAPAESAPVATEIANEPEGLKLMKASDCLTCHQQEVTIVGPSFKMIKEKYPLNDANVKDLTDKVLKGSVGVWGQVAMPNHTNLDKADAEKMVRYILSF